MRGVAQEVLSAADASFARVGRHGRESNVNPIGDGMK
jgi:hypothetical protein